MDGATDFSGDDLENIYVRSCNDGNIDDMFLFIGPAQSSTSKDIYNMLHEVLRGLNVEHVVRQKLVGFTADGASNMQGKTSGLVALLKEDYPCIITNHCLAHRLELAFKDCVKEASPKLYDKCITLLLGLYYLYRKSPKSKKSLYRAFDALEQKVLLPTRVGGTCWLPHIHRALHVFLRGYTVFVYHLQNSSHDNAKCEGLAKLATDGHVVVHLLHLSEVVGVLQRLSLVLQKSELSLADACARVDATVP
ncbi:E3 SUMO-protein ligase KIAA1586-like [Lingula anatina]|uniref:E3 SUMO-protein ligase KIAA1586-like n=1 Tax=Lingula anatina TaxID=7574 RepID=A0A1S3IJU7_LINAN|nr:E3 SUMO-protein ligase KIAA1586-like [Lingula anatina]|eukprot:XP_013398487.1 E3 SUMO-protein ligase KIAA1586-like [Lingula anatina]